MSWGRISLCQMIPVTRFIDGLFACQGLCPLAQHCGKVIKMKKRAVCVFALMNR